MMRRWITLFSIIAAVLLLDQVTKRIVVDTLQLGETHQPIPAIADFFQITRSQNTGAAFGFLSNASDLFLVIAVIVSVALIWYYRRLPDGVPLTRIGIGLVIGGALGNALDRVEYGAVVDFIHYQIPGVVSNVSNLADHAIVFGVIILFIDSWRVDRQKSRSEERELSAE